VLHRTRPLPPHRNSVATEGQPVARLRLGCLRTEARRELRASWRSASCDGEHRLDHEVLPVAGPVVDHPVVGVRGFRDLLDAATVVAVAREHIDPARHPGRLPGGVDYGSANARSTT